MCQYRSWAFLGCHMLLGEQLLPVWVRPYFGAEANAAHGALQKQGLCISGGQAIAPYSCYVTHISSTSSFYCKADFVIVLFRGGFTPRNLQKVVIRIQSSGVKQNWSVGFSKAGALLPWPLKDKCLIQTNPRCFSEGLSLLHSCCQGAWLLRRLLV